MAIGKKNYNWVGVTPKKMPFRCSVNRKIKVRGKKLKITTFNFFQQSKQRELSKGSIRHIHHFRQVTVCSTMLFSNSIGRIRAFKKEQGKKVTFMSPYLS